MAEARIAEHLLVEAVAQAQQAGGAEAVLVQIARVVGTGPTIARRSRTAGDRCAADRRIPGDPGAFSS